MAWFKCETVDLAYFQKISKLHLRQVNYLKNTKGCAESELALDLPLLAGLRTALAHKPAQVLQVRVAQHSLSIFHLVVLP
jgi:hypothetical protein